MKLKFGTLWFKNNPTLLQHISWNSYLKHGHELHIFLYDMSIKVPDGVIKRDANEILSEDHIFLPKLHHAKESSEHAEFAFADVFRIHMLKKERLVWTDSDMVCLSDDWPNPEPYLFGVFSNFPMGRPETSGVNNDILYIDNENILNDLLDEFQHIPKDFSGNRGLTGPNLLSSILIEHGVDGLAKEENMFHAIRWNGTYYFVDPDKLQEALDLTSSSLAVSFFHSSWVKYGLTIPSINDKPQNNYLGYLTKQYLG